MCSPVQGMILIDHIWKMNGETLARWSYHYHLLNFPCTMHVTVENVRYFSHTLYKYSTKLAFTFYFSSNLKCIIFSTINIGWRKNVYNTEILFIYLHLCFFFIYSMKPIFLLSSLNSYCFRSWIYPVPELRKLTLKKLNAKPLHSKVMFI